MARARQEVEFQSQGTTVRGHLYLPEGGSRRHPVVVMAGGWCYVKELVQPEYARVFADAGIAALVFDYRSFGASDGEPRQHLDPWAQIEDYKNAISWVETRAELDPERIAIWGISYSGGHVLVVGATDPRVRCIVSNIPVVDGLLTMKQVHGSLSFRRLQAAVLEDRRKRLAGAPSGYLPMSTDRPHEELSTWPFPEVKSAFLHFQKLQNFWIVRKSEIKAADILRVLKGNGHKGFAPHRNFRIGRLHFQKGQSRSRLVVRRRSAGLC